VICGKGEGGGVEGCMVSRWDIAWRWGVLWLNRYLKV
jgi:hypothetical protein